MKYLWALLVCGGCYLSHYPEHAGDASVDTPRVDVPRVDARPIDTRPDVPQVDSGPDAPPRIDAGAPDAGPLRCEGIFLAAEVLLDNDARNVTPRLVALPRGEVGVVFVSSDGSPTRIHYERLSSSLERITGDVVLTNRSFTWGEPARIGETLYVAYGNAGASRSVLHAFDLDGRSLASPFPVDIMHPIVLSPSARGLFWLAFEHSPNSLRAMHIDEMGIFAHERQAIDMGAYGSGSRAVPRPGGASHILAYTREASPGIRDAFVNAIDESGRLGPERRLSMDRDVSVAPVVRGEELLLVRHNEDRLIIERTDLHTLENIDRRPFSPIGARPLAAQLAGRLAVAHFDGEAALLDDFGHDIVEPARITVPLPGGWSGGADMLGVGDAVILVGDLSLDAARRIPWVGRFECLP